MRRRWLVVVALAALCAPATASAVFAPSPISGNPQGIKLAHQVMKAFGRIPAYRQSEQHFFQIKANRKARTFSYLFGDPHHAGYAWATEKATVALHHNRVVWWLDALTPSSGHSSPVEFVVNRHGHYWAFGTPSNHTCFTKLGSSNSVPYRYGGLGYSIGGRMEEPRQTASTDILPYVYRWKMHLTATETDTIRRSSKLVLAGKIKINRHEGSTVLAFSFANSYPRRAPRAPGVTLCRR